ncbi:MAG TPA: ATP-dependent zinc metalloprotease FtsH [Candidatus Limnocylindrales bacterium]|nr:ATP-dependent zinc metalloprotease FtsH [Candidatus Limnocylindrales bacterium]
MRKRIHFSVWYLLGVFLLLAIVHGFVNSQSAEQIPYSKFKEYLNKGRVKSVYIGVDIIHGEVISEEGGRKGKPFVVAKVDDPDLVRELEKNKVEYAGQFENPWVKELVSWVLPMLILFAVWIVVFKKVGPGGSIMSFAKTKAKLYSKDETNVTFDDVAGVEEAKEELIELIDFLKNPEKFRNLGGRVPKGFLLIGPPGTGKTLLARAVAGEAKVPFFSMSGSEFVEMFVGVGAARVRDLFHQAQQKAPCIIFIDELDALGKTRGGSSIGGHDEREQTLNQLLVEMDGFDSRKGIIVMAATNRPEILDPALLRPGRFDRQILVDRPDINGREKILQVHARQVKLGKEVDLRVIASRTPGFVGADLANVVNEAALLGARRNKSEVGMPELEEAIDRVVAGLEKKSRIMSKKEREIVAYHESGHALVAAFLPHTDPVHKVSIIPRGIAALGYTQYLPGEDRYLMTKSELLDRLCVALGGRVAEEIIFGEVSTGAHDDLQKATQIARRMVKEFGMSERLGLVTFERERKSLFLDNGLGVGKDYSEQTAYEIDLEVKRLIDETYDRVKEILETHRDKLEHLAKVLLEKEVVEGEEFKRIIAL